MMVSPDKTETKLAADALTQYNDYFIPRHLTLSWLSSGPLKQH